MKKIWRSLRKRFYKFFFIEYWSIGWIPKSIDCFIKPGANAIVTGCKWLDLPSKSSFLADPFLFFYQNKLYLFAECFDYITKRGTLCCYRLNSELQVIAEEVHIPVDAHLSYPFIFEHENKIYLIAETHHLNEIALYQFCSFPNQIKKVSTLLNNIQAIDNTLHYQDGYFWLFFCKARKERNDLLELHIAYATTPEGPYTMHPKNPIKKDNHGTQPAGKLFWSEGQLYRPAQNHHNGYGSSIVIQKILALSTTDFSEESWCTLLPDPQGDYPDGLHTLNSHDNLTVVDGKKIKFSLRRGIIRWQGRFNRWCAKK